MPVIGRQTRCKYEIEIRDRFCHLIDMMGERELSSPSEGCGRGHWKNPDLVCATKGTALDIRLACDAVSSILSELKKLK